jgi:hypothetical protein
MPIDRRNDFKLGREWVCFSDVLKTTPANGTTFAEEMRPRSLFHLVAPRLLNLMESVQGKRREGQKIVHG